MKALELIKALQTTLKLSHNQDLPIRIYGENRSFDISHINNDGEQWIEIKIR